MPFIKFTSNLKRHIECSDMQISGDSLSQVIQNLANENPKLANYLVDDQRQIRKHILVSIDNQLMNKQTNTNIPLNINSEVYFMQALSGG